MPRGLVRDALLYVAVMLVLGTVANLVPKRHLAWWGKGHEPPQPGVDYALIDPGSADAMRTSLPKILFLDTRSAGEFAGGHVPGAQLIAYTELPRDLTPARMAELRQADAVIVYGASEETELEQLVAQELHRRGLPPLQVLLGGFPAWQQAGLPLEGGAR